MIMSKVFSSWQAGSSKGDGRAACIANVVTGLWLLLSLFRNYPGDREIVLRHSQRHLRVFSYLGHAIDFMCWHRTIRELSGRPVLRICLPLKEHRLLTMQASWCPRQQATQLACHVHTRLLPPCYVHVTKRAPRCKHAQSSQITCGYKKSETEKPQRGTTIQHTLMESPCNQPAITALPQV